MRPISKAALVLSLLRAGQSIDIGPVSEHNLHELGSTFFPGKPRHFSGSGVFASLVQLQPFGDRLRQVAGCFTLEVERMLPRNLTEHLNIKSNNGQLVLGSLDQRESLTFTLTGSN